MGNGITGNRDDIADVQEDVVDVQSDIGNVQDVIVSHDSRLDKVEKIGSVWFDAWRTTFADAGTLTYEYVRRASSYPNAMDINNGVFTAPLAGTYQFIIQVAKSFSVEAELTIVHDGTIISWIADMDKPNGATLTGTAIVSMEIGQKVWVETKYLLLSGLPAIQFTGALLSAN